MIPVVASKYTNGTDPWEKQEGESSAGFAAFRVYLEIGPPRSLRAVADAVDRKLQTIKAHSSRGNWTERAAAWDAKVVEVEDAAILDRRAAMAAEQLEHWSAMRKLGMSEVARLINAARKRGNDGKPGILTPKEAVMIIDKATHYERLILGEVTERQSQQEELDLSKLSTDEVRLLRDLHRKASL